MITLSLAHVIDADDIARELAGMTPEEIKSFARDLVEGLWNHDESLVDAFCEGIEIERAEQTAEPLPA